MVILMVLGATVEGTVRSWGLGNGSFRQGSGFANFSKLQPWEGSGTGLGELRHPKIDLKRSILGAQGS